MLSLDLTPGELEQLKVAIERSLKDAIYFNRYSEMKNSRSLMDKIDGAIRKKATYDTMLDDMTDDMIDDLKEWWLP